ncbi:MAG: ZIP family metal transporter [Nocardioidaceae bacterium]
MAGTGVVSTLGFAAGASLPLLAGAIVGVYWRPPRQVVASALAFAAGALISAVAFDLFEDGYSGGGALRAGLGFAAGAAVFVAIDAALVKSTGTNPTGWALLAAVTLDGVPENSALGVTLNGVGSLALLVAVFVSNLPEAMAGAISMRSAGHSRGSIVGVWAGATVLLALAVVLGRLALAGATEQQLAWPLTFAAGAVLASVIDTLAPEAFRDGGPAVAMASSAGFFTAFVLSA